MTSRTRGTKVHDPEVGCCKRMKSRITGPLCDDLKASSFYDLEFKPALEKCIRLLGDREIEQIICYGLGEFVTGWLVEDSRYQLALLILMYQELKELGAPIKSYIEIYDPNFTEEDITVLSSFDCPRFKIIKENEQCARKIATSSQDRCALVYMPHMTRECYNNLLGANWSEEGLSKLVILGNHFSSMNDDMIDSSYRRNFHYLNQLVENFPKDEKLSKSRKRGKRLASRQTDKKQEDCQVGRALIELAVDNDKDYDGIFFCLAFHLLDKSWLRNNASKIEESRIKDWCCEIVSTTKEI